MAITTSRVLVQWALMAMLVIALVGGAMAIPICNIDSDQLNQCLPAVTGDSPPPPTEECCAVVKVADLPCLCGYRAVLPAFGYNTKNVLALPAKCGLKTPPECEMV